MKFKPLGERALVKMVEREEQEAGGIVLPDTAKKKPQTAEVIEVGKFENGIKVGAGDVVVLRKYAGVEIKLDDEEYLIVDAEELLGVVED
jgi:chaperonin GroES